jgi:hypothetical protein
MTTNTPLHALRLYFTGLFDKRFGRSRGPRDEYPLQGSKPGPMSDADSNPRPYGGASRRVEPLTAGVVTMSMVLAREKRALETALRKARFSRLQATAIVAVVAQWAHDTEHTPPPH